MHAPAADAPAAPLGRPTHVAVRDAAPPLRRGYWRDYAVGADGGRCQLQRVRVHVRYHCGDALLADYRQTYYEFFAFERDDAALVDTHDFDLVRDGWRQAVIVALLRRHGVDRALLARGAPRLTVHKQFTIAPGQVRDAAPRELRPGAAFGMLAAGPSGPARASLRVAAGAGWRRLDDLPPCPAGYPARGVGTFATRRGHRAFERYRHDFASLAGAFVDRARYTPTTLH